VVYLGPRVPGESVGPRPLSAVVVRPLNFTVRSHVAHLYVGTLVFFLVATVVAVAAHWRVHRYVIACAVTAVVTPILFLLISALHDKPPNFLGPKAWAEFALVSFLFSMLVGAFIAIPRRYLRRGS
jgi:hypothetical protein